MEISAMKVISVVLSLLLLGMSVHSEHIRGLVTQEIQLNVHQEQELSLEMTANELIVIALGGSTRFIRGIQIDVVLSDVLKRYSDSFGLSIYYDIEPRPHRGMRAFTGRKAFFSVLPFTNKSYAKIPLTEGQQTGAMPPGMLGITEVIKPSGFPLILTIQPIMKGVPDSVMNRKIFFTIRLDIEKRGLLDVNLIKPPGFEKEEAAILLDEEQVKTKDFPLELPSGLHKIAVVSDVFKPTTMNFALTPGQETILEIVLEPSISTLTIESIEGATVYLDGEKLSLSDSRGGRIQLTEGSHTIRFKLGEYSISKTFTVIRGKNYNVSLVFDIEMNES
jgi:hypothetical protein